MGAIRTFLRSVDQLDRAGVPSARTGKGLLFVQTYAVYEFAVASIVREILADLNARGLPFSRLRNQLLALALNGDFAAIRDGSIKKTWRSRIDLLLRARSQDPVQVPDALFPKDGSHYRVTQLRLIWELFDLPQPVLPKPELAQHIEEMVGHRNSIAHGSEAAEDVGARFTVSELERRILDTEQLCGHVVGAATTLLANPSRFE